MLKSFYIETGKRTDFIDITDKVQKAVEESGKREGICVVYVPHTTACVFINEGADPDVARDIAMLLERLVPWHDREYAHMEGNSAAHIRSAIIGNSRMIPFSQGKLLLGTWESIFFAEFDGPRRRKVMVYVI